MPKKMINWPVRREKSNSDWIKYTSDEDLDILMLLGQSDVPWTEETESLVEQIAARALQRMQQERMAAEKASVPTPAPIDLRSWLHIQWAHADAMVRQRLRILATALHLAVPDEPMRRTRWPVPEPAMRRTRPVPDASPDASPSMPRRRNAQHTAAEGAERVVDESPEPSADEYMLERRYDDESDWTPCTSLFDAFHPENRGWS